MKKNYEDMLSRFHTIPACHGQTDGRTGRIAISISRDKNDVGILFICAAFRTECRLTKYCGSRPHCVYTVYGYLSVHVQRSRPTACDKQ